MKRATALRNAAILAGRLRKLGGVVSTPEAGHEALRIRAAWVFGSTAKGADNPNDLDVLLDMKPCGRRNITQFLSRRGCSSDGHANAKLARGATRVYGCAKNAECTALVALRGGMKMVRFHSVRDDGSFADIPATKIMIYPRFELDIAGVGQ